MRRAELTRGLPPLEGIVPLIVEHLEKGVNVFGASEDLLHDSGRAHICAMGGLVIKRDVTARDHQRDDGQWTRGKSHDTFAPIGPCIETELDPGNIPISTYLNGELKQQGNTSDLIFPVPYLVSFISRVMTLLPGDVITTGTPSGIGPMKPGDTVEIRIDPIGILRNYVIAYSK